MKGLADRIGYKTLKAQFYDELEKSKTAKAEDDDQKKDTLEAEIDSCNTEEIRLREKVKWLEAELNIKEKQDSKKNDKLNFYGNLCSQIWKKLYQSQPLNRNCQD